MEESPARAWRRCVAWGLCLALLAFATMPQFAIAQESGALLDMLVCKKILTTDEAERFRADILLKKEDSSASKIKLSGPVTELALYGDIRFRFQYDNVDKQLQVFDADRDRLVDPGHGDQRDRLRFRIRLNADFKLADNWFGGVQIQTSPNSDTSNQTYIGGFQNYSVFISRAFVGWNATDWLTLVGGKQADPFYDNDLVWYPIINPSGVTERFELHKLFRCDPSKTPWKLTLITGQFFFDDNQEYNPPGRNTDAYLFQEQLVFAYQFCDDVKLTIAPAYLAYNAAQVNTVFNIQGFAQVINGTSFDGLPPGWGETRDLSIIQVPGDFSFKVCGWKVKILWNAACNTAGTKRVNDIYVLPIYDAAGNIVGFDHVVNHARKDNVAWLAGFQVGENVKKGDWSLLVNYRQVGLGSLDPNLNDSDWGLSRLNLKGWKASIAYNFTDAVILQVAGYNGDNLRKNLTGGQATGGAELADGNSVQVFQVDFDVKF